VQVHGNFSHLLLRHANKQAVLWSNLGALYPGTNMKLGLLCKNYREGR
jgi:hypothetical protein